jgi:torulene dioxygenase
MLKTGIFLGLIATITSAQKDNAACFGPPPHADPLTFGFYATPEHQQPTQLETEGQFPTWLSGSLYRGAAGTWDAGNYTAEHWFDGFSRNHRFEIDSGVVSYRSRNASDELADFVQETGRYPNGAFGGDPCKIIFGAFEVTFRDGIHPVGNESASDVPVAWIANLGGLARNSSLEGAPFDTLVMTTEGNRLQQIDPVDLNPIELFDYQAYDLALNDSGRMAAHGSHSADGTMYNYNLLLDTKPPTYQVFGVESGRGKTTILANIKDAPPAYIHSTFNTENYIILIIWQADYTQQGKTILQSLGPWDPARKSLFYVVDRINGGVVAKYASADSFFAFHQINSFEDPSSGDIIIDLPTMADYRFLFSANVDSLRANLGNPGYSAFDVPGNFTRYRLPMNSKSHPAKYPNGTLTIQPAEVVFSLPYHTSNIELPRINDAYARKPYRYAYGVHLEKPGYFVDSLIKVDTTTQATKLWSPTVNQLPCEPIFVPSPDAQAEDDGVLLTVAMDSSTRRSALVVINATTMEEVGRAKMPSAMGYGFHGAWGGNDREYSSYY